MTYNVSGYSSWVRNTSSPSDRPGEVFSSPFGFIGAGQCNCIDTTLEAGSCYGVIGGGQCNKICAGTCFSSVLGGQGNIVQHNWASVSGYNITSAMDCAMHANNFIGQNIPIGTLVGGIPVEPTGVTGMLWYYPDVYGNNVVYMHS